MKDLRFSVQPCSHGPMPMIRTDVDNAIVRLDPEQVLELASKLTGCALNGDVYLCVELSKAELFPQRHYEDNDMQMSQIQATGRATGRPHELIESARRLGITDFRLTAARPNPWGENWSIEVVQ